MRCVNQILKPLLLANPPLLKLLLLTNLQLLAYIIIGSVNKIGRNANIEIGFKEFVSCLQALYIEP